MPASRGELHSAVELRDKLVALNKRAAELILENGILLQRIKNDAVYREWGYESFDEAIERMQEAGQLDYGARQARNFVAIVEMYQQHGLSEGDIEGVSISKLREIATVRNTDDQKRLLKAAPALSVKQVQHEAKVVRDKALGRDVDPLHPWTFMFTETQRTLCNDALSLAKVVYSFDEQTNPANVLEAILADFMAGGGAQFAQQEQEAQPALDEPPDWVTGELPPPDEA